MPTFIFRIWPFGHFFGQKPTFAIRVDAKNGQFWTNLWPFAHFLPTFVKIFGHKKWAKKH